MKRLILIFLVLTLLVPLFSALNVREDLFVSGKELDSFVREDVNAYDESFYDNMKIYLLTGGEGSHIWENFGHSAFVIEGADTVPVVFDYGIFTFDESFIPNFILGKLYYEVWETYAMYRITDLENNDRSVSLLLLDLDSSAKKALFSFLLYNTKEENRTYLYDYFSDNCATRLRDIYSWATDGEFESWLRNQKSSESIRDGVSRHLSRSTFFASWVINYLLGPSVDKECTRWEECYLPSSLEKAIEEYQKSESDVIYRTEKRKPTPERWNLVLYSALFGISLALLAFIASCTKYHHVCDFILGAVFTVFGLMSLILIFFAFFTIHYVTHGNMNIFIITPLCLVTGILHFMSAGRKRKEKAIGRCALIMDAFLVLTVIIRLIFHSVLVQNIWAPAVTAAVLYTAEALPLFLKRK